MKVLVLGHKGMLGHMVSKLLTSKDVEVITTKCRWSTSCFKDTIKNFDGDYRKALATIDRFSTQMSQLDSVYEVRVLSLPLDIGPDASLQGSSKKDASNANFSVRVVLGVKDEAGRF